jgi:hypothetical protein|tara:strand:- start:9052 stop:9165 length:114 start_codon:yes stop_codon:yes gene_type:complete
MQITPEVLASEAELGRKLGNKEFETLLNLLKKLTATP